MKVRAMMQLLNVKKLTSGRTQVKVGAMMQLLRKNRDCKGMTMEEMKAFERKKTQMNLNGAEEWWGNRSLRTWSWKQG